MTIQKTINEYLDAVEKKFGTEAREQTTLVHEDGSVFVLKRHSDKRPSTVMMGDLLLMTKHLKKTTQS